MWVPFLLALFPNSHYNLQDSHCRKILKMNSRHLIINKQI
ncbi:hypothetical protein MuYL_0789 [Mucilaginibacter xinganensis]|uniref:Uncharacterized protein n=1 Tax=Mucilaginibacter xinganensis TaxID=1234841 RepID=A0A223NS13_9SPHI|nr:hypothetical protein MuYL_0789 [Mucilaginibacter xinganensis]